MLRTTSAVVVLLALAACASGPGGGDTVKLWNGRDLGGWHADVPGKDQNTTLGPSFVARGDSLVSLGTPEGHLTTDASFRDYRLTIEWRWPEKPGNNGVLVHTSTPRWLAGLYPKSIEVQLESGNAGDFWCIGEDVAVPDMEKRRGPKDRWGVGEDKLRRIENLTNGAEKPVGEWNEMVIECRGRGIDVWVNGVFVNSGANCTTDHGQITLQAERAVCEFRKVELQKL